jgi:hypothetical protein
MGLFLFLLVQNGLVSAGYLLLLHITQSMHKFTQIQQQLGFGLVPRISCVDAWLFGTLHVMLLKVIWIYRSIRAVVVCACLLKASVCCKLAIAQEELFLATLGLL